jgi:hypothetical protein
MCTVYIYAYIEGAALQAQYSIAKVVAPPAKCRDGKIPDVIQEQRVSYTVARMYTKPPMPPPPCILLFNGLHVYLHMPIVCQICPGFCNVFFV